MGAWAPTIKVSDPFKLMQTTTPGTHVPDLFHWRQQGVHTHNWPHAVTALSATYPRQRCSYNRFETQKLLTLVVVCPRLWEGDMDHNLLGRKDEYFQSRSVACSWYIWASRWRTQSKKRRRAHRLCLWIWIAMVLGGSIQMMLLACLKLLRRFSQRNIFRKSMDSKLALPQALPLPPGA